MIRWQFDVLAAELQMDATPGAVREQAAQYVDERLEGYALLKPPEGIVYILEADGEVAGMLGLAKLSAGVGELPHLWVDPDYRGQGYGRLLLARALDAAGDLGCFTVKLSTPKWAHAAQHLYRSAGFQDAGDYPESEVRPGIRYLYLYMERHEAGR